MKTLEEFCVRSPWPYLSLALIVLLVGACAVPTDTSVDLEGGSTTFTHGLIVLLPGNSSKNIARCLKSELEQRVTRRPFLVDSQVFRDTMFPWFEPETAPKTSEDLRELLSRPLVSKRLAALRVRYVVSFATSTEGGDVFPGLLCGGGYGGGGCFGLGIAEEKTHVSAVAWDVGIGNKAAELSATSTGTSVIPAFLLPFPFIAYTEDDACEALANSLAQLLHDPSKMGATER